MSDNRRIGLCAVLAAALALTSVTAAANGKRMQFVVSVQVIGSCHIMMPGSYISRKTSTRALALNCARNTAYSVSVDSVGHPADSTDRTLAGVGNGLTQVIPISSRIHNFASGIVSGTDGHTIMVTITY